MPPSETTIDAFVTSFRGASDSVPGARVLGSIASAVQARSARLSTGDYNERYIDGGPAWGEHINYSDGGQHGETHRPK